MGAFMPDLISKKLFKYESLVKYLVDGGGKLTGMSRELSASSEILCTNERFPF